tara:strand:+ start:178 stop:513 length:336 start_codon:yes stop_codon:yes gene_type:complete
MSNLKVTELRIGNLASVLVDQDPIDVWQDTVITIQLLDECLLNPEHFKPIPLTEEWLKRFDWENRKDKDLAVSFGLTSGTIHFVAGNYYTECDTVHHFQNLYYDLKVKNYR